MGLRHLVFKMPAWNLIRTACVRPIGLCRGVPGRSNAFEIARRLGLSEVIVRQAQGLTNQDRDVNRIIEKLEAQTLESRKRLESIRDVEQENLKFNRVLKKLYNELTRERETELNKARKEAQEIVDLALAESDQILQGLHAKSKLKPHEIIEAKSQLKKLAPETVDLSKNKVLKQAKKARAPKKSETRSWSSAMDKEEVLPSSSRMVVGKPKWD